MSFAKPEQRIEWLGLIWDSCNFCLIIPERRILDLKSTLNQISKIPYRVTERGLAKCAGKVISLIPVVGNIARIMTRYLYMEIQTRSAWYGPFSLSPDSPCLREVHFWNRNVDNLNMRELSLYHPTSSLVYCDASHRGRGSFIVNCRQRFFTALGQMKRRVKVRLLENLKQFFWP